MNNFKCEYCGKEHPNPSVEEAEYQGRKVNLNKPFRTPKGPKKFSVYVKNDKGNVVKVNFGSPDMEIKRDDPERRKNFRARMKCDTAKDKTSPRYWSCKFWSSKSVSDLLKGEDKLPGGLADNRPDEDFDPEQLRMGIEIEFEHTKDKDLAKEIAKDHLAEIPDYYTRLKEMEREAGVNEQMAFDHKKHIEQLQSIAEKIKYPKRKMNGRRG